MSDPQFTKTEPALRAITSDEGSFFENLDPYVALRLLAENPVNLDQEVVWRYADIVEGGYATEEGLYEGVPEHASCLIVTEGSSDGLLLSKALPTVAPDIADFFTFVDMSENYPFTGTGNVYRFCQGLARIRIQNRVLVVLDNDTVGRAARERIQALDLPPRMRVTQLPNLADAQKVVTLGPSGNTVQDVNGRAVSIECFLDIWSHEQHRPVVRWTSYDEDLDAYHGELIGKEAYVRHFVQALKRGDSYDFSRLQTVWDHLFKVCTDN